MKIIYKARLGDGPIQIVGETELDDWVKEAYEITDEESLKNFLMNAGSDWAYEAVHSDCLDCWAEVSE